MTKIKKLHKKQILILLALIAIIFLMISEYSETGIRTDKLEEQENRLEQKLSETIEKLDGVSDVDVIVTIDSYEENSGSPCVRGVSIICYGKQKDELKIKIVMIVSTALGISSDKIFVSFS